MNPLTLVIGNKNTSSWSMRPWILLKTFGIPFTEIKLPLYTPEFKNQVAAYSPSGKVPVLMEVEAATGKKLLIHDSLAICEYVAENFPHLPLWPKEKNKRARARSFACEMHSGFAPLREHMTMNITGRFPDRGRTPDALKDIERIQNIWTECLQEGGPFLFQDFGIVDAMFAPVVGRFTTYGVTLNKACQGYQEKIISLPAYQEWLRDAEMEVKAGPGPSSI